MTVTRLDFVRGEKQFPEESNPNTVEQLKNGLQRTQNRFIK